MTATKRRVACALLALLALSCSRGIRSGGDSDGGAGPVGVAVDADRPIPGEAEGGLIRLVILGTNDLHGHLDPTTVKGEDGAEIRVGGAGLMSAYFARLKERFKDRVIHLDAGDMFQGTLLSNTFKGEPVIAFYNAVGVTAACLGNHEFDYGPVAGHHTTARDGEDPLGAIKARVREAHFPILAGNVLDLQTGQVVDWATPAVVREIAGIKVGILGLTTLDTPAATRAENVQTLRFDDLVRATKGWSRWLRSRGAEIVLVVAHAGANCSGDDIDARGASFDPDDRDACVDGDEIIPLAKALPKGTVDAIVAGHTHKRISHFVNDIPIIESYAYGRAFGRIDLFWDPAERELVSKHTRIHQPVRFCERFFESSGDCAAELGGRKGPTKPASYLGAPVRPDPAMNPLLARWRFEVASRQAEVLGNAASPLQKPGGDTMSTNLGRLISDAMLAAVDGAHVAAYNPGGIRASIDSGPITYGEVYRVIPFENDLEVIELNGFQLIDLATLGSCGTGGGFQFSGIKREVDAKEKPERHKDLDGNKRIDTWERCRLISVTLADGSFIQPESRYKVVIHDFLGSGGDRLDRILGERPPEKRNILVDKRVRDAVAELIRARRQVGGEPDDGRVKYVP